MLHKGKYKLFENPEMAKNMGAKGKINIEENFNIDRHIKLLDELIDKAVNPNSRTEKTERLAT